MTAKPTGPLFLGLCTGRCGSRYLTSVLNAVGIPTLHEANTPSLARWSNHGRAVGEVNGHFVTQLDPWPDARIWHFSRHPQPFVSSLMKFGFWNMNAPCIHPYLRRTGDLWADSFRYWVDWNKRIIEAAPHPRRITFRIEDIDSDLIAYLAKSIGMEAKLGGAAPQWLEKQEFAKIPEAVALEVADMMAELGYEEEC